MSDLSDLRFRIGTAVRGHLEGYATRLDHSRLDDKLIRDPIFGFQRIRSYEALVVDSPLFQRLRGIFQTSVAYLTYPSAIHTRFEHSLNCLNLAERVIEGLERNQTLTVDPTHRAEIRLAALLHDIGHCIFSHGSEFYYRTFDEIRAALRDPELAGGKPSAGEVINYCILTSNEFRDLLWDPIRKRCRGGADYVDGIELKSVAQMIIGMSPAGRPERRFQAEIVNGPLDVDKLDYLSRDSYFSGVDLAIDIDRLIPSLRVETVPGRNGVEDRRLVVDHRGIAVVEQLLFGRMVLYDTVYHHHKVRAANAALQQLFQAHGEKAVWPTRSGFLKSIEDLLDIDEYDFFGFPYHDPEVKAAVRRIRTRCLPERALVLTPRAFVDQDSYTTWSTRWNDLANSADTIDRERADEWRETVVEKIRAHAVDAGAFDLASDEIVLDVPEPPGFGRLGQETLVRIVPEYVIPLSELFPFQKVVNNYSTQYKYRSYVFAPERWRAEAAYGAFRALGDEGLQLNDLALILAHQNDARARDLLNTNGVRIPDWRKEFYAPDTNEMLVIDDENPPDSSSE